MKMENFREKGNTTINLYQSMGIFRKDFTIDGKSSQGIEHDGCYD